MSPNDWSRLWWRIQQRLIRVIDVVSILVLDGVLLLVGYSLVYLSQRLPQSGDANVGVAKQVSHFVFLLLYLAWVIVDLFEYWKVVYASTKPLPQPEGRQAGRRPL